MIREVGESIGRTVLEGIGRASGRVQERKSLPVDLLESDDAYLVVFDAPGASAGDVNVELVGRTLEIDIERFRGLHEGFSMRFPGRGLSLHGEVDLPPDADVDAESADATVTKNGTLEVLIPKDGPETEPEGEPVDVASEGDVAENGQADEDPAPGTDAVSDEDAA